jgi:hypothetical protein
VIHAALGIDIDDIVASDRKNSLDRLRAQLRTKEVPETSSNAAGGDLPDVANDAEISSMINAVGGEEYLKLWQEASRRKRQTAALPNFLCTMPKDEGVACEQQDNNNDEDTGTSDEVEAEERYYYDESAGTCRKIIFSGCGGNRNNFETYKECANFCGEFDGMFSSCLLHLDAKNDKKKIQTVQALWPLSKWQGAARIPPCPALSS